VKNRKTGRGDGFSEGKKILLRKSHQTLRRVTQDFETRGISIRDCADHGADKRDLFAGAAGKRRGAGSSQGSAGLLTLMLAADDSASLGRTLGNAWTQRRLGTARWPGFDEGLTREDEVEIPCR